MSINEYRLEIKVKNNLILKRIEELGFSSLMDFCKKNDIPTSLYGIVNLKESPLLQDGSFKPIIIKVSNILKLVPEMLFTENQLYAELETNKSTLEIKEAEVQYYLNQSNENILDSPEKSYAEEGMLSQLEKTLCNLTPLENEIISMRYGLAPYNHSHTYDEISKNFNFTRERARHIECKALRKMRRHATSEKLKDYID